MGSVGAKGNNTRTLSEATKAAIDNYIEGSGRLSAAQAEEVLQASTTYSNSLYRVEDADWMGGRLKVGQEFIFNEPVKSFTTDWDGVRTVVGEGDDAGLYESSVVVYQTVGSVKSLDISSLSRNHAEEKEHLVGGRFVVVSKKRGPEVYGYKTTIIQVRQV